MNKATLRRQFLAQRQALSANEVSIRNQLITQHFSDFLEKCTVTSELGFIHTFLPIIRQNEVDTWPIIRGIWGKFSHIQIAVPVTNASTHTLSHYLLSPATLLIENRWGIPEPVPTDSQPLSSDIFNLVFVPLLVFDQQGHRVGYGGGFYDRFLSECRPDCLKIGVSLFEPHRTYRRCGTNRHTVGYLYYTGTDLSFFYPLARNHTWKHESHLKFGVTHVLI